MTIHPVGTTVDIHKEITGTITAVCIRGKDLVTYELSFWDGFDYKVIWVQAADIKTKNIKKTTIGFHNAK